MGNGVWIQSDAVVNPVRCNGRLSGDVPEYGGSHVLLFLIETGGLLNGG